MSVETAVAVPTTLSLPRRPRLSRLRLALLVAAAAALAAAALLAGGVLGRSGPSDAAGAAAAEIAAAHRQAVDRARARERDAAAPPASRVVEGSTASDLFAAHSWYVAPPPPPAAVPGPPPPPPVPTAPPFPYTYMGAYTPDGGRTVYFLARGDRVIDAHVGDRLDGIYDFESASAGQLIFNYMPLNIRQPLTTGTQP
jgi:hypothetical protein